MSHIPSSAVPHAKTHEHHEQHDAPATKPAKTKTISPDAAQIGREALATVKAHPKTAIAIGATILAGAVAAIASPLLAKRADDKPKRPRAAKKTKSA